MDHIQDIEMFKRGDIVWGKIKSFPWWPAMVLNAEECRRKENDENKLWLFWFGDHKFSQLDRDKVTDFKEHYYRNIEKRLGKYFKKALEEVLQVLASMNGLQIHDFSELLKWANSGFCSSSPVIFKWEKIELPDIVVAAIAKCVKLSIEESESDESDMDLDDDLSDVRKGLKTLDDICIACCKKGSKLLAPHPLFVGNLCVSCKRNVFKICSLPNGQIQDYCIICAQGGNIVYCSNNLCFRAFCQMCIEYMVSVKAYEKIVKNDKWLCFLCKTDPDKNCLIKRKSTHEEYIPPLPQVPEKKTPISVIAVNESGRKALQKANIKVKTYYINPPTETTPESKIMEYSTDYKDFSFEEITEISADLIIGSFFPPKDSNNRKECATMFFISFYRFLYRLDISRLVKKNIFFIFLADARLLDENILARVKRFLLVDPVSVMFGDICILIWSRLSKCLSLPLAAFRKEVFTDCSTAEESIMLPYMMYLKKYFEEE